MEHSQTDQRLSYIIAFVLPLSLYYFFVASLALNLPFGDDYGNILLFLVRFLQLDGQTIEQLKLIFIENNQHRNAFSHILYLATYFLSGKINFYTLVLVGNSAIALLCLCYALQLKGRLADPFILLSLCLLVLQPQGWGNMLWAMSSNANNFVLLFSFAAIWCFLSTQKAVVVIGSVLALIATFTQAHGILSFVAVAMIWILVPERRPGPFSLIVLIITAVLAGASFFNELSFQPQDGLSHWQGTSLGAGIGQLLMHWFVLLGSSLGGHNIYLSGPIGLLLAGLVVALYFSNFPKQHTVLFGFILFLLLSSMAVSLGRSQLGIEQASSLRYRLISGHLMALELLALLYIVLGHWPGQRRRIIRITLAFAFVFSASSYLLHTPDAIKNQRSIQQEMQTWLLTGQDFGLHMPFAPRMLAQFALKTVMRKDIYQPFSGTMFRYAYLDFRRLEQCNFDDSPGMTLALDDFHDGSNEVLRLTGSVIIDNQQRTIYRKYRYLILCSEQGDFSFKMPYKYSQPPLRELQPGQSWENFELVFPRRLIPAGEYRVGLQLYAPDGDIFDWAEQPLLLKSYL